MSRPESTVEAHDKGKDNMDLDSTDDRANQGLEKLGYKQELLRSRGTLHLVFTFGLSAPIATSLVGGGPAVIVWGWVLVSVLSNALLLSLGELSSKYPTSAGAYYWCYRISPPRYRLLLSWINGWLNMVGVWTICLSVVFGTAQILVAGVTIFYPQWVATPWQTYLIFVAVLIWTSIFIIFFNRILPTLDIIAGVWTAVGVIITMICFSVKAAAGRRSASFALGHFDPSASGWTPGWSFFIGLLPVSYVLAANGMIASMAEEVHNPTYQLPRALAWSPLIGLICGIVYLLPIMFTLPDIALLLAVPGGQPLGVMFEAIMGSKAGVFGIGMLCAISISCAASRATWSFARDKAIPFHTVFARVNHRLDDVPVYAYLLSTVIQLLLALIFLGSTAAFNAFTGVATISLQASYAMPVAVSLATGRKDVADAPFNLGIWGVPLNVIAVLWTSLQLVLFSMPAVIPVTKSSMNYASVVFVGFAAISAVWYLIDGRFHYEGPPMPDEVIEKNDPK
ncbi:amino acid transporter [Tricholoma matsutake]|nr:amino acid transporter [Tricholoma matsutake 945]